MQVELRVWNKFFTEALRVLKPGGVLVYRDAEAVMNKTEVVKVLFKDFSVRMFTHIFLSKFLDQYHGVLAHSGTKYISCDPNDLTFVFIRKMNSMCMNTIMNSIYRLDRVK